MVNKSEELLAIMSFTSNVLTHGVSKISPVLFVEKVLPRKILNNWINPLYYKLEQTQTATTEYFYHLI